MITIWWLITSNRPVDPPNKQTLWQFSWKIVVFVLVYAVLFDGLIIYLVVRTIQDMNVGIW